MKNLKANIMLSRGDLDSAELLANQCVKAATKRGIKKYLGKAERLLGEILIEREQYDQSEDKLRTALTLLEEVGNPKQIWETSASLAELYKRMNRTDLQREQSQKAVGIVKSTAEKLQDKTLKATFLAASPIRQIIEKT